MSRAALGVVFALLGSAAVADNSPKGEIRIGQRLPYSGPVSGFGIIGRAQEAYFEKVNAEGGINGRKIKFITLDDAYSPPKTVEQTRKLVEQEEVLLMFGSLDWRRQIRFIGFVLSLMEEARQGKWDTR